MQKCLNQVVLKKNLLNSKVLKPSSVEPVKQWPRGSSVNEPIHMHIQGVFFNWSPPKFFKYKIPCKLAQNFSKCQIL